MQVREVTIAGAGVTLGGSLWLPSGAAPHVGVVMVGGSGASDRHNDVFFPPIREHLLAQGIGVLSYDKRGVGASTGSWPDSSIDDLAADARAAYEFLQAERDIGPVGLFGHSEGGWTVLRAAADCAGLAYVVTNSTPGMTPAVQDRYAVEFGMRTAGQSPHRIRAALTLYDELIEEARRGTSFAEVAERMRRDPELIAYFGDPDDDDWRSVRTKLDHDPASDLATLDCPQLALFGGADQLVPVPASLEIFASAAAERPSNAPLTVALFPGADHRLATQGGLLAATYLDTLSDWISRAATGGK
jgi:uncharacterized protein